MSESIHNQHPYKKLGLRLKLLRQKRNESLAEVSGAVEIEADLLAKIEQGSYRPAEDVLLLLISHLDPQEEEAVRIWEMAGYDQTSDDAPGTMAKPIIMLMQPDSRIMYSDMVNVVTNQEGVVVNFLQAQGNGQGSPIARVGMSQQQAVRVVQALQQSLQRGAPAPKALPPVSRKPIIDQTEAQ